MSFYIIVLLEKKGDIEEAEEKIAKLSIHGEGQEEKAGGKFPEILRKEKFKVNFCNKCREGIYYVNFIG